MFHPQPKTLKKHQTKGPEKKTSEIWRIIQESRNRLTKVRDKDQQIPPRKGSRMSPVNGPL